MNNNISLNTESYNQTEAYEKRWSVLWILCGSLVLVVASVSSLNVAIPSIQDSLNTSGAELQWIIDAYALTFAGILLPAGALGDRYGRRKALIFGLAVFGLASIAGMMATSAVQLIIWRSIMGLGAAFIMPATLSIITTVFPPNERQKAIAIWAGFAGAGGVVGLLSSGLLLKVFWWGSLFAVNVPIVLLMIGAVYLIVPTSKDEAATPLDPIGSALSIIGLVSIVFGIIEGPEVGWSSARTVTAFVIGAGALVAFVIWELRTKHPMLDPRFFKNRYFSLGAIIITATFFGIFGMFFILTQYLQFVQEYDALGAGLRILPFSIFMMIVAPQSAGWAKRFGDRNVMVVGMLAASAGFILMSRLEANSSYPILFMAISFVAVGIGSLMPPATSSVVSSLPPGKAGVGSAVNDTTREVGGSIGIAIVGALLSIGYRNGLDGATDNLDEETAERASDSIGELIRVSKTMDSESADQLLNTGKAAFVDGVGLGMTTSAGLLLSCALLVALLYPKSAKERSDFV